MTIIGVAPTVRQRNVEAIDPDAVAYLSYRLEPPTGTAILLRSQGDPGSLTSAVREAVQATDPDQPVAWLMYDVPFVPGKPLYLTVASYHRTQTRHSEHIKPIRILLEP